MKMKTIREKRAAREADKLACQERARALSEDRKLRGLARKEAKEAKEAAKRKKSDQGD